MTIKFVIKTKIYLRSGQNKYNMYPSELANRASEFYGVNHRWEGRT